MAVNSFTTIRVQAGAKTPVPWDSYCRNNAESTVT